MKKILFTLTLLMACFTNINAGTYRGFVDVSPKIAFVDLDLTTTHGYQFNNRFYLGAGTGILNSLFLEEDSFLGESQFSIPLFVKFRIDNFSEKRWTPFGEIRLGCGFRIFDCEIEDCCSIYSSILGGMRCAFTERTGLNLGIGVTLSPGYIRDYYYGDDNDSSIALHISINIGVDF